MMWWRICGLCFIVRLYAVRHWTTTEIFLGNSSTGSLRFHADMNGKKILLGATGSVAAIRVPVIAEMFLELGAEVKIMPTSRAEFFIEKEVRGHGGERRR